MIEKRYNTNESNRDSRPSPHAPHESYMLARVHPIAVRTALHPCTVSWMGSNSRVSSVSGMIKKLGDRDLKEGHESEIE